MRMCICSILGLLLLASSVRAADVPDASMLIDKVWSGHPVPFALLTERGHQFVAYYDAERRLTVAGRELSATGWTRVATEGVPLPSRNRMSNVTGWDSHNRIVMALDRDGCLHLSANMHADPLVYYRTRKPFDLSTLERLDRMTGRRESKATYPRFFKNAEGVLYFRYRDGGSGNGNDLYNVYDPNTRTWKRLFDTALLDGEGERSAYSSGPSIGPDGRFHLIWMWRETPDALTNNTLSYARSPDLIHWETSTGRPLTLPIKRSTAEVIDPAKPRQGLINMCYQLGFDKQQRPVAVYHRFDAAGHSQAFAARPDAEGHWQPRQLSEWNFRWDFSGSGSQARQVSLGRPELDADGNLIVAYSAREAGSGRWRLDAATLAPLAKLPAVGSSLPRAFREPTSDYPGIAVRTQSSTDAGIRWVMRWETLGLNRELKDRQVPPPSELRLYKFPATTNAEDDAVDR